MTRKVAVAACCLLLAGVARAQSSASFSLEEHSLNSGGRPLGGFVAASASFAVTLDAIGDTVVAAVGAEPSSASFATGSGFVVGFAPAGEVVGVVALGDKATLEWEPEPSVGSYSVYRDLVSTLSGLGYGACLLQDLPDETALDGAVPPAGDGFFYLVTAENRLGEEGPKSFDSEGNEARGVPCP